MMRKDVAYVSCGHGSHCHDAVLGEVLSYAKVILLFDHYRLRKS